MLEFIGGIAVGAAFSPFWIKVWGFIHEKISVVITKTPPTNPPV